MKNWNFLRICLVFFLVFFFVSCSSSREQTGTPIKNGEQAKDTYEEVFELAQGWTDDTQQSFYFTTQGSKILPYSWFLVLEQENNQELFRSYENMDRLRYLPVKPSEKNPDGLPIGWAKDTDTDTDTENNDWVGLTCAACHTTQIDYTNPQTKKTTRIRIDGAPTLSDFETMNLELVAALKATAKEQDKFDRFAQKVLGSQDTQSARQELQTELQKQTQILDRRNQINQSKVPYGYGRVDAIGAIFNQVASTFIDLPKNTHPSNAPVSYPFLWGTSQSDVVQWTGFAPNNIAGLPKLLGGVGPLVRNGGEVLGVYGEIEISKLNPTAKNLEKLGEMLEENDEDTLSEIVDFLATVEGVQNLVYPSSMKILNLGYLETWVEELRSPQWPSPVFPAIDQEKAKKGESAYSEYCASCHEVIPREKENEPYRAVLTPLDVVRTDPKEIENIVVIRKSGRYTGRKTDVVAGDTIDPTSDVLPMLENAVIGGLLYDLVSTVEASFISRYDGFDAPDEIPVEVYKARPLNGIWATAPYLHNGSVPNLWELMLPEQERSKTFQLGSREYDPVKVGFVQKQSKTPNMTPFTFDTTKEGNLNSGHTYGADLPEDLRWAILEYMKTL